MKKIEKETWSFPAPAKINLFLHVLNQREDGYHNIQTIYQFIDYSDVLTFSLRDDQKINLISSLAVKTEDNLVYKAAKLLQETMHVHNGVNIQLKKCLPIGGGLGGGSSDAATVLLALNQLWKLQLGHEALKALGKQLGVDVPVFIEGHASWGEGIGDELTPIILPEYWYLLLVPPCQILTPTIYQDPRLTRDSAALKISTYHPSDGHNDLETVVRMDYPEVAKAIDWLGQFSKAKMTGSGAVVFAGFDTREEASRIAALAPTNYKTIVAKGMNHSPLHMVLE